jgi:hypothetical protein
MESITSFSIQPRYAFKKFSKIWEDLLKCTMDEGKFENNIVKTEVQQWLRNQDNSSPHLQEDDGMLE